MIPPVGRSSIGPARIPVGAQDQGTLRHCDFKGADLTGTRKKGSGEKRGWKPRETDDPGLRLFFWLTRLQSGGHDPGKRPKLHPGLRGRRRWGKAKRSGGRASSHSFAFILPSLVKPLRTGIGGEGPSRS